MSEQVMRVSNIGKKYELMTEQDKHDTFASVLLNSFKGGFKKKKNKGEFWALKDVSFNVNKGERIGIIGHNGAGKSTLLKVFSRITVPTEGEIEVKGKIASLLEVGTGFHMELTGRENIYLNGSILGMSRAEIDSKFDDIVNFSEIGKFLDTPVKKYSSGMFVKLAFAVASHLDPDILIVDEVLAVGDMKFQEKCLGKMEDVSGDGKTVLYVSHSMRTVQQLCNRVIVMDHGKIIFDGDVDAGIKIYMNNTKKMERFNDLSKIKRQHEYGKDIIMKNIEVLNDKQNIFYSNESIDFKLTLESFKDFKDLKVRITMLYADKTPAGTMTTKQGININKNDTKSITLSSNIENLAPGKYLAKIVIYQNGEAGSFINYDVVEEGFSFEIAQDKNEKLDWQHRWWGHTRLPEIELS